MSKKIISVFIFAAGLIIGAGGFYLFQTQNNLSPEKAGEVAMDFINKAVEQNNVTASLMSVAEESGIYKVRLKIEDKEYDSFISKDGKYLFSSAFDLKTEMVQEENQ